MTGSEPFFQFGTDIDTIRACLSLIERAARGELRAERLNRGQKMTGKRNAPARRYRMGRHNKVTADRLRRIVALHDAGCCTRLIAKQLNLSPSTVWAHLRSAKSAA